MNIKLLSDLMLSQCRNRNSVLSKDLLAPAKANSLILNTISKPLGVVFPVALSLLELPRWTTQIIAYTLGILQFVSFPIGYSASKYPFL